MERKQFLKLLGAAVGGAVLAACGGGSDQQGDADAPLSDDEIAGLLFMREEEKLAHDVYVALYQRWDAVPAARIFANIAQSEAEHTEAVRQLILSHGLEDPSVAQAGVFVNTTLQALYDDLVSRGQGSLADALAVGCLIEEKDIHDINEKIAQVFDEPDIVRVYEHLLCGSRNHLRAFNSVLLEQGVSYAPQVLTQPEWDAIAYSADEICGR